MNGGLFVILVFLTYKFVFSNLDFNHMFLHLQELNDFYLLLAFVGVISMLSLETLTIKRNLKILDEEVSFIQCIKYTFAGNFFSAITPAATGGQPMQVLLMHKDGISTEKSTLALLMDLSAYQSAIVTYALIGFILFKDKIEAMFGGYYIIVVIGILFNLALLLIVLLLIFSNKLLYQIISGFENLLGFFKYKRIDSLRDKTDKWIARYKQSAQILKANRSKSIVNTILMYLKIMIMFSFPFLIYKGLGLKGHSFLFILSMQAVLHISYAALPLPGGVGIGETAFLLSFGFIFPKATLDTAMLLSRGIGFYFVVFISGVALMLSHLKDSFNQNEKEA